MDAFSARGKQASQLRQRKYDLVRSLSLPESLLAGSFAFSHRRCGKQGCHCASGRGHGRWVLTSSRGGRRRVQGVPEPWRQQVEEAVLQTHAFLRAVEELMAINVELLALSRGQRRERKCTPRGRDRRFLSK